VADSLLQAVATLIGTVLGTIGTAWIARARDWESKGPLVLGAVVGAAAGFLIGLSVAQLTNGEPTTTTTSTTTSTSTTTTTLPPRADITSLRPGQRVPTTFSVEGTYSNLGEGHEIWLLVIPQGIGYFPQNGPAVKVEGNRWINQPINLGGPSGTRFRVQVVIVTTDEVKRQFREFVDVCRQGGCPDALQELPKGVVRGEAVAVAKR
jgi:hypothetical protein